MKVIGTVNNNTYLCEVSHTELEKLLNLYYKKKNKLEVGETIDLGIGYDWYRDTKDALDETKRFFKNNINNINAITRAFTISDYEQ